MPDTGAYIGRFAPSPTGPLHFGSLVAAMASYLEAKVNAGRWLVRMEDVDRPREMPGAADSILAALSAYGFEWQGEVMYQSRRDHVYEAALQVLQAQGRCYPCACSRREIADSAQPGVEGLVYPGTCRHGLAADKSARAWRVRTPDVELEQRIVVHDAVQGISQQNLARDIGDFVLKRADGLFAYQLAVVVDDAEQGVTHVVRGADLLDSTPRQLYLQQLLGYASPAYAHVPIASNAQGEKLSKQTLAPALDMRNAANTLSRALAFLGQQPPPGLSQASLQEVWAWAQAHWRLSAVPRQRKLQADPFLL